MILRLGHVGQKSRKEEKKTNNKKVFLSILLALFLCTKANVRFSMFLCNVQQQAHSRQTSKDIHPSCFLLNIPSFRCVAFACVRQDVNMIILFSAHVCVSVHVI